MSVPRFACVDCGAAFSGLLRSARHGLVPSDTCVTCTGRRVREACVYRQAHEDADRDDRRVNRAIAVMIAVAIVAAAALIVAWFFAASPASAGAHRDTTQLGADGYVAEAAVRAALARLRLDGGAGSVGVRWADGGATAVVALDAGLRASRSDGGAR